MARSCRALTPGARGGGHAADGRPREPARRSARRPRHTAARFTSDASCAGFAHNVFEIVRETWRDGSPGGRHWQRCRLLKPGRERSTRTGILASSRTSTGSDSPWHGLVTKHLTAEFILDRVVLEIGCGRGELVRRLAERGPRHLVAADFAKSAVQFGRRRMGAVDHGRLSWAVASIQDIPLATGAFDTVISCETIEHVVKSGAGVARDSPRAPPRWTSAADDAELHGPDGPLSWLPPRARPTIHRGGTAHLPPHLAAEDAGLAPIAQA